MSETENANNALIELDSLQGEAAVTLKDYFSTIHSPIISGIMCACTNLYINLRAFFEEYHSTTSVLDCFDNLVTVYGVGEMLAVLGISAADYSKLLKKGLKIRSFKGSNGEIMFKIVGDGMSRDSIKSILNGMNISHMTPAKINKLTGKGLVVLDQASNIRSAGLMNTLTEVDGFKSASRIMTTGDMPPLVKWKGYSKLVDGIGWGIDGGVNFFDNCYDENGRGWTFTGETIGDTLTDTAVDIGLDIGIEATCAFLGSFIPIPIVGTVVGYAAGVAISTFVSTKKWGEPPKTISDMTKDIVSDISHSITDSLPRLFW